MYPTKVGELGYDEDKQMQRRARVLAWGVGRGGGGWWDIQVTGLKGGRKQSFDCLFTIMFQLNAGLGRRGGLRRKGEGENEGSLSKTSRFNV